MQFLGGLDIRYDRELLKTPITSECGKKFNLSHVLNCTKGGYTYPCQNRIRDTRANLMKKFCYNVKIEPEL